MNIQEAGDAPRILHSGSSQPTGEKMTDGGMLTLETGFQYEVIRGLLGRGHRIGYNRGSYGGYQGIMYDAETMFIMAHLNHEKMDRRLVTRTSFRLDLLAE